MLGFWKGGCGELILQRKSGQNGPLPLIIEIFCPETLFGKNIAKYHFLWYSSLVSSSTPFFYSSMAPDMASGI